MWQYYFENVKDLELGASPFYAVVLILIHFSSGRRLDSIVRSMKVDEVDAVATAVYPEVAHLSRNTGSDLKTSVESIVDQLKGSTLSGQYSLRGSNDMPGRYSGKVCFNDQCFLYKVDRSFVIAIMCILKIYLCT